jgi:hypothetical protein
MKRIDFNFSDPDQPRERLALFRYPFRVSVGNGMVTWIEGKIKGVKVGIAIPPKGREIMLYNWGDPGKFMSLRIIKGDRYRDRDSGAVLTLLQALSVLLGMDI